jgi:hypothetical protein
MPRTRAAAFRTIRFAQFRRALQLQGRITALDGEGHGVAGTTLTKRRTSEKLPIFLPSMAVTTSPT